MLNIIIIIRYIFYNKYSISVKIKLFFLIIIMLSSLYLTIVKQFLINHQIYITEINFKGQPSLSLTLLNWSCKEDCSYICTWRTVDSFISHGLKVPQFHGKVSIETEKLKIIQFYKNNFYCVSQIMIVFYNK